MDKVSELKEMIVNLKLDIIKLQVQEGHCPYSLYKPSVGRVVYCADCSKCRKDFLDDMEKVIRAEVEKL